MSLQQVPSDNNESRIEPRDDHNHFDRNWNFNQSFFYHFSINTHCFLSTYTLKYTTF